MKSLGNIGIIGDSYSTYEGYNENYRSYYGPSRNFLNGINCVQQIWWHIVLMETKSKLRINCSHSGSCVCYTSYGGEICKESSFIERTKVHFSKNIFDTIFLFGGTNDSWANSPIGNVKYELWNEDDLKSFLPSVCFLCDYLKKKQPQSRIIYIINSDLKDEITNGIIKVCNHYNIDFLLLHDIEKENNHPNIKGMKSIANQIIHFLNDHP